MRSPRRVDLILFFLNIRRRHGECYNEKEEEEEEDEEDEEEGEEEEQAKEEEGEPNVSLSS